MSKAWVLSDCRIEYKPNFWKPSFNVFVTYSHDSNEQNTTTYKHKFKSLQLAEIFYKQVFKDFKEQN